MTGNKNKNRSDIRDYDVLLKNLQKNTGDSISVQFDGGGFSSQN